MHDGWFHTILTYIQMRSSQNRCSTCNQLFLSTLALDCGHSICPACVECLLRQQEEHERLLDELDIECSSCSYVTQIAIALAYKIVRPLRDNAGVSHWKHCRSMVCMECLDGCFPIDDYLTGEHSSHQVLPINQAYNKIKDVLFYQEKRLEEIVTQCDLQGERLIHCKTMLNDVLNANAVKIKVAFENLKEQITRKEMEVLDYYQERIHGLFGSIDEAIAQSRKRSKLCQHHIDCITEKIPNISQNCINNQLMIQTVTYYIENQHKIATLTQKSKDQNISIIMEELQENRKIVNLQELRKIQKSIRTLDVFKVNDKAATASTCSLSREYFDTKRKEVFNSTPPESTYCKLKPFDHFRSMRHLQSYNKKETTNQKIEDFRQKLKGSSIRHR